MQYLHGVTKIHSRTHTITHTHTHNIYIYIYIYEGQKGKVV